MLGRFASRSNDNGRVSPEVPLAREVPPAQKVPLAQEVPLAHEPPPAAADPSARPKSVSCLAAGMSITGNIVSDGMMQVFGRIEGEVRSDEIEIGDGAEIVGNIVAQDLTIRGRVRGTIRAVRVKLQGNGAVEGDIFHRSLSIEEHALFEGNSRRVENPIDPVETRATGPQVRSIFKPSLAPIGEIAPDTSAA